MKGHAVALAAVLVAAVTGPGGAARAESGAEEQLVTAITVARERGCSGHAGSKAALRWSPALAQAAARIARGDAAMAAIEAQGYRATRAFHTSFVGYRTAGQVAAEFSRYYCAALTDPALTDVGFHREGSRWQVVLAARLDFPQLADRHAVLARVLGLVNDARGHARRCGDRSFEAAPPLQWNAQLEQAAAAHAADMAAHAFIEHRGSDGSAPSQRVSRAGYNWRSVGENVAAGQRSAEEVVDDWLQSPGHCANIMEPAFTQMGAAFTVNMQAKAAVYWAQEFGKPR